MDTNTLEWEIEGEIMTTWPEFAFAGAKAKVAIISDIHVRFVNNGPLWPNLRDFVTNYIETVIETQRGKGWTVGEILANWGNLLSMLNVG